MSPATEGVIISGLGLIFVVLTGMLGLLIRIVQKWTRTEERLNNVAADVKDLADNSDRRITWLEQNLWTRGNMGSRPRRPGG